MRCVMLLLSLMAASALPAAPTAHTYTWYPGSLTKGHDVILPLNLTLAAAKAKCSSLTACVGITFDAPTQAPAGVVQVFFKNASSPPPSGGPVTGQTYLRDDFPMQYPGPPWMHPKIHQSPFCLHIAGWHDMAGALTFKGTHHAFQGCPASGGWSHSRSSDLVHWQDLGRGIHTLHESYEGMVSDEIPCSGFATVDDKGVPCAGFRQCGSSKGTTGLNPAAHTWDVPMEIRCATNENLTTWGSPEYIYPLYFYRHLPYDPVRPWRETGPGGDGKWYSSWSSDGCNKTGGDGTQKTPCHAGGQLELLSAATLRGPWTQLPPMFTTNITCSAGACKHGAITNEFVTSGYFGGLAGDPDGGSTRVVTQNNAGPTYWIGQQQNGGKFVPFWDKIGAVGHYDYGSLTMAHTLGSDPNQVAVNGRRVLLGWIGSASRDIYRPASQSLARDLTLSADYELLQQFVPELKVLRTPTSHTLHYFDGSGNDDGSSVPADVKIGGSQQLEVVATFSWPASFEPSAAFGVTVLGGAANLTIDCANALCQGQVNGKGGPIMPLKTRSITLHAIIDHAIVEVIYNNRTAMVVYAYPPSAAAKACSLFGVGSGVKGTIETWELKQANNFGPQP
jgi:sucrose-6-phosphate hydrolase SacC (GH32 family)